MSEITCSVIQDLLPNYAEGLISPETAAIIRDHLENCPECRRLYEDCQKPVDLPRPEEIKADKKSSVRFGCSRCGICSGRACMPFP